MSRERQERERLEGRWERYILWYLEEGHIRMRRKTFNTREELDSWLSAHPKYVADRIDMSVQTIIWSSEENHG